MNLAELAERATPPLDVVEEFTRELHPHLETIVHKYCDEAYGAIMENVQDYLRDNVKFNIKSRFDTQQRELVDVYRAIEAIYGALDLQEAKDHAYAVRKGIWTLEKAAQYHLLAEARARAFASPADLNGGD